MRSCWGLITAYLLCGVFPGPTVASWPVVQGDKQVVHTCAGDTAEFPWWYDDSRLIRGVEIRRDHPTTPIMLSKATNQTNFYKYDGVDFLPNAGMTLKDVTASHAGLYQCTVVFVDGDFATGDAELTVIPVHDCPWKGQNNDPSVVITELGGSEDILTATEIRSKGPVSLNITVVIPRAKPPASCTLAQLVNDSISEAHCTGSADRNDTCSNILEFTEDGSFNVTFEYIAYKPRTMEITVRIGPYAPEDGSNTSGRAIVGIMVAVVAAGLLLVLCVILYKRGKPPQKEKQTADTHELAHLENGTRLLSEGQESKSPADPSKTSGSGDVENTNTDREAGEATALLVSDGAANEVDHDNTAKIGPELGDSSSISSLLQEDRDDQHGRRSPCPQEQQENTTITESLDTAHNQDSENSANDMDAPQDQVDKTSSNVSMTDQPESGTTSGMESGNKDEDEPGNNRSAAPGLDTWREPKKEDETIFEQNASTDDQKMPLDPDHYTDIPDLTEPQSKLVNKIKDSFKDDGCLNTFINDARETSASFKQMIKNTFVTKEMFNQLDDVIHIPQDEPLVMGLRSYITNLVIGLLSHLAKTQTKEFESLDHTPVLIGRLAYDWKVLCLDEFVYRCIVQLVCKEDNIDVNTDDPELRRTHQDRLTTIASHYKAIVLTVVNTLLPNARGGYISKVEQTNSAVTFILTRICLKNHRHDMKIKVVFGYTIPGTTATSYFKDKKMSLLSRTENKISRKLADLFVVPTEKHWLTSREVDDFISEECNKISPQTNALFRVFTIIVKHFFIVTNNDPDPESSIAICKVINDDDNECILENMWYDFVIQKMGKDDWGTSRLVTRLTELLRRSVTMETNGGTGNTCKEGTMFWPDVYDMCNTNDQLGIDLGTPNSKLNNSLARYQADMDNLISFILSASHDVNPSCDKGEESSQSDSSLPATKYLYLNHPWIRWCMRREQKPPPGLQHGSAGVKSAKNEESSIEDSDDIDDLLSKLKL